VRALPLPSDAPAAGRASCLLQRCSRRSSHTRLLQVRRWELHRSARDRGALHGAGTGRAAHSTPHPLCDVALHPQGRASHTTPCTPDSQPLRRTPRWQVRSLIDLRNFYSPQAPFLCSPLVRPRPARADPQRPVRPDASPTPPQRAAPGGATQDMIRSDNTSSRARSHGFLPAPAERPPPPPPLVLGGHAASLTSY